MDADAIEETLNEVFRNVFEKPDLTIRKEMTANDVDGWDSLTHITLIAAVEKKFQLKFSTRDIAALQNVGNLIELIEAKQRA